MLIAIRNFPSWNILRSLDLQIGLDILIIYDGVVYWPRPVMPLVVPDQAD